MDEEIGPVIHHFVQVVPINMTQVLVAVSKRIKPVYICIKRAHGLSAKRFEVSEDFVGVLFWINFFIYFCNLSFEVNQE